MKNRKYQGDAWKSFRKDIIESDGFRCSQCGRNSFDVVLQVHHKKYIKGNRYTTKSMSWFVKNEYIYILNFTGNLITITGLWEDPILAANFHNYCKEKDCVNCESNCIDYLKTDFPIDSENKLLLSS